MSPFMTRLVLAPCLFTFNWLIYALVYMIFDDKLGMNDDTSLLLSDCIMAPIFAAAWVAVWFTVVEWNSVRAVGTAGAFFGACFLAFGYFHTMSWAARYQDEFNYILAYMFWMASWITATTLMWRATTRERALKQADAKSGIVLCPNCRYNLKGLRQTKCPECGMDYTIDQLLAAATGSTDNTPQ